MAIEVVVETDIAVPPEAAFAMLADVDGWPSWLIATGVVAVRRASADPVAAGDRVTIDQRAAGRASVVEATVTALEAPARFGVEGRDADGVRTSLDAELTPSGESGTRLRWSVRVEVPLRYRVFESFARPQVERAATLDVEALRRRLESVATG